MNFLADGAKRGVIVDSNILSVINQNSKGTFNRKRLSEKIIVNHLGFAQHKNCPLFVVQLFESGLAEHNIKRHTFSSKIEDDQGAQVLTLLQIGAGFEVCLACMAIAILFFFGEISTILVRFCVRFFKNQFQY